MGTRTGRIVLLLVVIGLAVTSLAWAQATPEEAVAVPAPEMAQADDAAPVTSTVEPPVATTVTPPAPVPVAVVVPTPETLGVTQDTSGIAYYYNDRDWEVWINLGDINGLRPTAQVEFLRCGQVVGTGCVKTVRDVDAIVTPVPGTPAGAIHVGDAVRVCVNGTRAALERQLAKERWWNIAGQVFFTALIYFHG